MRFLVIGGGNIAHSLAASIARREDVAVLTRRPDDWANRLNDSPFAVCATKDPSVVSEAEIIFVALPSFAIRETLVRIDPYLRTGQTICLTPANTLIPDLVETYAKKGVDVVCLQRVPYIARIEEYGRRVRTSPPRAVHKLFVPHDELKPMWTSLCRELFEGEAEFLHSPLTFVFNNSNPLLHPARLVVLFRDWRNKIFTRNPLFYAEWTDESSELYIKADEEMYAVLKAADPTGACVLDYESVLDHYGVTSVSEMTAKLRSIEGFKSIESPMCERATGLWVPDFRSRYFTEDIRGTRTIYELACRLGVETPTLGALLDRMYAITGA